MKIIIDYRETELIQNIQHLNGLPAYTSVKVVVKPLDLGDILLQDENEIEHVLFERKTLTDLASSIKDSRYEEQSYRLQGLNSVHNHNIVYLIEGIFAAFSGNNYGKNKVDKMTLYSSLFSLNYYKGFSVMRTTDIAETALYICNCATKLSRELAKCRLPFYKNLITDTNKETIESSEKDYVHVIKKVKKENITPQNIGEIMLCQIPSISAVSALAILKHYGTLALLLETIQKNPDSLQEIYVGEKGQMRKLSKTCISNLLSFLVNPSKNTDTFV
jgi:ERCC4-type nuclease